MAAAPISDAITVRVLGTAQDGGVPQMGCLLDCCRGGAAPRRLVSSLALCTPTATFLLDATPDIREQVAMLQSASPAPRFNPTNIFDGVFCTHAHLGHYVGLLQFGKEAVCASRLPVWCSARFAEFLRSNEPFRALVTDGRVELRILVPGERVQLSGGVSVTPVAVKHRAELSDTLAFVIRADDGSGGLLYCPDADDWSWPLEDALRCDGGVSVALLDGTFYDGTELPGRDMREVPHPLISESVERLRPLVEAEGAGNCVEVYFTHFNHTNRALREAALIPAPFRRLEDGQVFDLRTLALL